MQLHPILFYSNIIFYLHIHSPIRVKDLEQHLVALQLQVDPLHMLVACLPEGIHVLVGIHFSVKVVVEVIVLYKVFVSVVVNI